MKKIISIIIPTLIISVYIACSKEKQSETPQNTNTTISTIIQTPNKPTIPLENNETNTTLVENNATQHQKIDPTNGYDILSMTPKHPSSYIAEMCYTKTKDTQGSAHNPCFACHINAKKPNFTIYDEALQASYDFPDSALVNPFINAFKNFSQDIKEISDEEIQNYINQDNYFDENHSIILEKKLTTLSSDWDYNKDGQWNGYIPDCYFNFNSEGFDVAPDGNFSRWRAFAYMPFLGTFWPTNGSTDDVMIRLPLSFAKKDENSTLDIETYKINLAIVEAMITQHDVFIDEIDEREYGVDINKDGSLGVSTKISYDWAPLENHNMSYVGLAKRELENNNLHIAAGLYPEGTEFLHTVRYIQSDSNGTIGLSKHLKELRYAKKVFWLSYSSLKNVSQKSVLEKDLDPDILETFKGNIEIGLGNNRGWLYQGFIEDMYGDLRPQSYEETLYCMGCHSEIGATTDTTFAFARKLNAKDSFQKGWYHWSQHSLKEVKEFLYSDGEGELTHYLKVNDFGDEFRENSEIKSKFFTINNELNETMLTALHKDVTLLLNPSHQRAVSLNKAYRSLVKYQRFIDGRAAHAMPLTNVYKEVNSSQETGNTIILRREFMKQ